jgi:hypothetical protein
VRVDGGLEKIFQPNSSKKLPIKPKISLLAYIKPKILVLSAFELKVYMTAPS